MVKCENRKEKANGFAFFSKRVQSTRDLKPEAMCFSTAGGCVCKK
jgi:hypothetical protein